MSMTYNRPVRRALSAAEVADSRRHLQKIDPETGLARYALATMATQAAWKLAFGGAK